LGIQRLLVRVLCAVVLVAVPGLPFSLDSAPIPAEDLRKIELQVHQIVNQERSSLRLPELIWNEQLAAEARRHAIRIANAHFFAHQDPIRGDIDQRLDRSGIEWLRCAENLYEGSTHDFVKDAVRVWLLSSGHRKNMLDSMFSETGVGVAMRQDKTFVIVQEYILR
jgi:uncharacterized protein YkwD